MPGQEIKALDLFAGTGWGVACQRLGISEVGVENAPAAVATRAVAGMTTAYNDVWDGLADVSLVPAYNFLIASPPCQTFSVAGGGAGRRALDDVVGLIREGAHKLPGAALRDLAEERGLDPRTALVLAPLVHVYRDRPMYVALEQVPSVLPVWEAYASELESLGYSAVAAVLSTEQYGVPQVRKRAVLIARRDGFPATLPVITHSSYDVRRPDRMEAGVLPWVTVGEALAGIPVEPAAPVSAASGRARQEALALIPEGGNWRDLPVDVAQRVLKGMHKASGGRTGVLRRLHSRRPSPTIVGSVNQLATYRGHPTEHRPINSAEAAAIQTYPAGFPFAGTEAQRLLQIGNAVPPLFAQAIIVTATSSSSTAAPSA